jgi:hypothetical protein
MVGRTGSSSPLETKSNLEAARKNPKLKRQQQLGFVG